MQRTDSAGVAGAEPFSNVGCRTQRGWGNTRAASDHQRHNESGKRRTNWTVSLSERAPV